jgi:Lrp/AsnC family leucine-responsive transcriptional regulator
MIILVKARKHEIVRLSRLRSADKGKPTAFLDAFEADITKVPEVLSCYLLAGSADYLVHIVFRDTGDLERIHADILTRLPHVARIHSTLSLRTVKQTTALPI